MAGRTGTAGAPLIESMPRELLREPLNWIFAEHHRQRQLCNILEHLARSATFEPEPIQAAAEYLRVDLPLHFVDEEEDLFPLLRQRVEPGDDIDRVLGALAADHSDELGRAGELLSHLEAALEKQTPVSGDPAASRALTSFARHQRHHLAIENAVVLPIARMRLIEADHVALSRRLAARRGVVLNAEAAPQEGSAT